ncbi:MAG TPA: 3-oxoacyl-[acyl-carrier-protein] synthase III C-terminal domain-containing protein [Kofleriaceae bacterium]|nr:3-oxoacyl-[acyl-carrier-protein] synthase III C-terminal domain-containing protein [Kofleriaceae bacterium]
MLARFVATPPRFEIAQDRALAWLAAAHARGERDELERARLAARIGAVIRHVACSPDQIARRGHSIEDLDAPGGPRLVDAGTAARTRAFQEVVDAYFARAYEGERVPPDELVHVTCTGYASPSGAQKIVAARRWATRVTHAYHMGCYAAVPALRIAAGSLATGARRVDIAHTELCSLHVDPRDHAPGQLVVQSLFGDGLVRYTLVPERAAGVEPGLRVLALHERVVPDSGDAMTWIAGDRGMQMTLARDVPELVAREVRGFTLELFGRAGGSVAAAKHAVFAIHPGGPKIVERVREMLELDPAQVATSHAVLHDHGNMSSATLPYIWTRMIADGRIPRGALVASLSFGPGLTICGALLEKR